MSSSSSSSSGMEEKCVSLILACNSNCLLSSAFRQLHFSATPLLQLPKPTLGTPIDEKIRNLRASFAAAADRFVRALQAVAAENPLSLHLRSFSQVRARYSLTPNSLSVHNFAAILPGDSVAGLVVANGVSNFLNIYNTLLVVRLVLTWFPNSPPAIVSPLSTICDPYLNIFRGLIPPLGGLDLSPILAFLVLNAFTSTAAALPAELPTTAASQTLSSSPPNLMNITKMQEKWMRRILCRNGTRTSDDAN